MLIAPFLCLLMCYSSAGSRIGDVTPNEGVHTDRWIDDKVELDKINVSLMTANGKICKPKTLVGPLKIEIDHHLEQKWTGLHNRFGRYKAEKYICPIKDQTKTFLLINFVYLRTSR